jgi:hypothetical protein
MVFVPCRGVLSITAFSPLGILQFIPYAKNAPLVLETRRLVN